MMADQDSGNLPVAARSAQSPATAVAGPDSNGLPAWLLLPVLRVAGVAVAGGAFLAAFVAFLGAQAEWVSAAGGLGAVALGAQQVYAHVQAGEARQRKLRSRARLIRRSLVDSCSSSETAANMAEWLERIGNGRTLDTLQEQFKELTDLAAELGGPHSGLADQAFEKFLRAADEINPLYARRPTPAT